MIVDINGERPECIEPEDWETIKQMVSEFRSEDIKTPIPNADKLRSMTDEELAHTLLHLDSFNTFCTIFKECVERVNQGEDIPESRCEACILRWLREEYPTAPRPEWQLRMLRTFGGNADV